MAEQTFNQAIEGYWREPNKSSLPKKSGVYFVYECTFNNSAVTIHKLIYIGESDDVNKRVGNHEKLSDWENHVREGNQLCYSFTAVDSNYRERVEAAYIFKHKPPVNVEHKNAFSFDKTTVKSSGTSALLSENFTVTRT